VDIYFIDDLRNFLFGNPGQGGLDLASLNIQRGRDHGLPGFNDYRAIYGLPPYTSWDQVNPDPAVWQRLAAVYASIDDCDVYTCGLAEYHNYSNVGITFSNSITNEYTRFRSGDRFWYENNQWNLTEFNQIFATQLRDVILRNTQIDPSALQCFVMAAPDGCGKAITPPPPVNPVDYNITVALKTKQHPYYGMGSAYGFVVNGVEGPVLTMVRGANYYFYTQISCSHSFIIVSSPEPGQPTPGGYNSSATRVTDPDDDNGVTVDQQFGCLDDGHREMIVFIDYNLPEYIYYQCDFHSLMGGLIQLVNPANTVPVTSSPVLTSGAIAGIVIGGFAFLVIVTVILVLIGRRVRRRDHVFS